MAIHPPAPEAVPESTVGLNKRSASERSESRGTSASSTIVSAAAMGLPHQLPLHHLHHHAHHLAQHSTQHHFPQLHHRHPAQQQQQHQQHHGLWMGDAGLTAGVDHTLGATHDATASAPHARTHHLPVQMMPMAGYGQPYATASRSTSATTASAAMSAPSSASSASSITRGRHFAAPGSGGMAMAMPSGHVSASHAGGAGAGAGAGAYAASAWNQGPAAVSAFVHTGGTQHHGAVARAPMGSYVGGSANTSPAHSDHNSYDGHDAVAAAAAAAKLDAARPAWARRSDTSEGILEEMGKLGCNYFVVASGGHRCTHHLLCLFCVVHFVLVVHLQLPSTRPVYSRHKVAVLWPTCAWKIPRRWVCGVGLLGCLSSPHTDPNGLLHHAGLHFIKKRQRLSRSTHRAVVRTWHSVVFPPLVASYTAFPPFNLLQQQHKRVKLDIEVNTSDGVPAALGVVMFVMVQARDLSTRGRVTKVFVPSEPKVRDTGVV